MAIKKGVYYINGVERVLYSDPERDSLADVLRRYGLTPEDRLRFRAMRELHDHP